MLKSLISLFFPICCHVCGRSLSEGEKILCLKCISALPRTDFHVWENNDLMKKLVNLQKLQRASAFLKFTKGEKTQRLVHKLKYENHPDIGLALGDLYGRELRQAGYDSLVDIIIPIPLHKSKLRKRGYNQSAQFAAGLSKALEIPWSDSAVARKVNNPSQTHKSKTERWSSVEGIFHVKRPELILDKNILLVDDVITTGATIESCGMELEKYCKSISVAAIASA